MIRNLFISAIFVMCMVPASSAPAFSTELFVVGDQCAGHYDGSEWHDITGDIIPFPNLCAVWGVSNDEVYAVGARDSDFHADGVICRYDGAEWAEIAVVPGISFYCIWGSSSDDIYAGGASTTTTHGTVYHWDGISWNLVLEPTQRIFELWGTGFYDVYAAGERGIVYHYNFVEWSQVRDYQFVPEPGWTGNEHIFGVWSGIVSDFWVAGCDISTLTEGSSETEYVYAFIQHCLYSNWQEKIYLPGQSDMEDLACKAIWGSPGGELFVTTGSTPYFGAWDWNAGYVYDGFTWTEHDSILGDQLWGGSDTEVYVVGCNTIYRYDGAVWTEMDPGIDKRLHSVWGDTSSTTTGEAIPPVGFSLEQNLPNPFNPTTTIRYSLPNRGHVSLRVYDATGAHVATLVEGVQSEGPHSTRWNGLNADGREAASGVYFYRLSINGSECSKKMVLLR